MDMRPIVFLDIDGVLNLHEHDPDVLCGQFHLDKVDRLNRLLRETGAFIVLSSAWRYLVHRGEMNLAGLEWLLRSHRVLANRLIGITREDTMVREVYNGFPSSWPVVNERAQQVAEWRVANLHAGPYVILDDLDLGFTDADMVFIHVDDICGLADADVDEAIPILRVAPREILAFSREDAERAVRAIAAGANGGAAGEAGDEKGAIT